MALFRGIGARKDTSRGTSPIEVRKTIAALFARPGVLPGGASPLLTGDATWAYNVGIANFVTSRGASDGDQLYGNDGAVLIGTTGVGSTVPIAPAAGLQRIDIAWTRHPTNLENADTSSEPLFGVASGTAVSSSPVAPSIPAGALEIGRNTMTSAATSTSSAGNTITQSALYTAVRGAPVPFRNQAERDAYPAPYDGLEGRRLDLHLIETYDGSGWRSQVPAVSAGRTADISFAGTETDVVSAPAVTGDGVKKFKITATVWTLGATVAGDIFELRLKDASSGTLLTAQRVMAQITSTGATDGATITTAHVPAAGTRVYKLAVIRTGGTGTGTVKATATSPAEIIVEQIA